MKICFLIGHTYVAAKSDKNWPGRFARRTIIDISRDGTRTITYCRNERDTSFKFHETSAEAFERWACPARTSALWGKDDEAMILRKRK